MSSNKLGIFTPDLFRFETMGIQEQWLARFNRIVAMEIRAAGGREADGYRAVAAKTGIGYDYIYQIYKGKGGEKPKTPGADAMNAIDRVYGIEAAPAAAKTSTRWRKIANNLARQLDGHRVDPAAFLGLVDLMDRAIPEMADDAEVESTVKQHLRLVA